MSAEGRSLLAFLAAPAVVADPDGRAVYVNPAFETRLGVPKPGAHGVPLAELFEGGAREQVLKAVAEVCERGEIVRFKLRHAGAGWIAAASPIVADRTRVGAIVLLQEEPVGEERLQALHRSVQEPLAELARCLDALLEQTGGRRSERHRLAIEDGLRAVERIRKWSDDLAPGLAPRAASPATRFDPAAVVRTAAARFHRLCEAGGVPLDVLLPSQLPTLPGDGDRLAEALGRLMEVRVATVPPPASLTIAAKSVGRGDDVSVLISLTDVPALGREPEPATPEPAEVREIVASLGGALHTTADPLAGRTTTIRLKS